ncbi:hypothetical protein R6242_21740 [Iodobacter sp. CM08]|uniref:hypothetical protein n=1 Tax=Iodobacter sp. CM08 TaxID=3085902 RepID=UPI0029816FAF|nr:hypothetical protein [Iodobacter sp. CM08]MDW5419200.1 hypothetical protein [Iodobacter sp. CM08]
MGKIKNEIKDIHNHEDVDFIIKLAGLGCTICFLLGAGMSSSLYSTEIGSNNNSWLLGIYLLAITLLVLIFMFFSKTTKLVTKWAGSGIIFLFSVSYLLTNAVVSPYIFSSIPWTFKLLGLFIGIGTNLCWVIYSAKNITMIVSNPLLKQSLYREEADKFIYKNGIQQTIIEKKLKRRYLPHPILWVILIPLQPFSFILHEIIISNFGVDFFSIFMSAISLPLSLMFNGMIVSHLLVYFYYPSILKKTTGKEVHVI